MQTKHKELKDVVAKTLERNRKIIANLQEKENKLIHQKILKTYDIDALS